MPSRPNLRRALMCMEPMFMATEHLLLPRGEGIVISHNCCWGKVLCTDYKRHGIG